MGKTAAGAVWLDGTLTSPYDYYQFWINTDDPDVVRFLKLFTFLPIEEINAIEGLGGADLNSVKAVLAFEATGIVHGIKEAEMAHAAANQMFGGRDIPQDILPSSTIHQTAIVPQSETVPSTSLKKAIFEQGVAAFKLFKRNWLVAFWW